MDQPEVKGQSGDLADVVAGFLDAALGDLKDAREGLRYGGDVAEAVDLLSSVAVALAFGATEFKGLLARREVLQ